MLVGVGPVDLVQQRNAVVIGLGGGKSEPVSGKKIRDRPGLTGLDDRALVHRGEKAGSETAAPVVGEAASIRQDDEGGQVVSQVPQSIRNPGTHGGKSGQQKPVVHQIGALAMDVGPSLHGHEKGHFIDKLRLRGKEAADPFAGGPVLFKWEGTFHQGPLHSGGSFNLGFGAQLLTVQSFQLRLVVPRVHRAHPSVHEELDDATHFRGVVDVSVETGFGQSSFPCPAFPGEEMRQGQPGKSPAETGEQVTPVLRDWIHGMLPGWLF